MAWVTLPRLAIALALSAAVTHPQTVGSPSPAVHGVAKGFLGWDAAHYLAIAQHGYVTIFDSIFFPLQPLLTRSVATVLGFPNAAIATVWLAFGFAVWGIFDVATRLTSRRAALAAALLFAWNPVSVFFVVGYAESLIVALTIWSLRFCMDRRWVAAAVLAGAASAVVPQGALSGVVVVVGILVAERGVRRVALAVGCGIISELGLIGYGIFCWSRFGNPLEFQTVASTFWHEQLTYPLHIFVQDLQLSGLTNGQRPLITESHFIFFLDAAGCLVALGALAVAGTWCVRDRRWVLPTLLLFLGAALNLSTFDQWGDGEARFVSAMVTVYLVGALVFYRLALRSWLIGAAVLVPSAVVAIYVETLFHMTHWVT